jgi:hypothetical protein
MKWHYAPLAALGFLTLAGGEAAAASPEFCTLYAQEVADRARADGSAAGAPAVIRDRAYYRCLNQDDEPALPSVQAAAEPKPRDGDVTGTVSTPARTEAKANPETQPGVKTPPAAIAEVPEAAEPEPPKARAKGRFRGSGFQQGSKEWAAWCAGHYKSFDPATGYYQPFSGPKTLCR